MNTLIFVGGHGVCTDPTAPLESSSWAGIYPEEQSLYYDHIKAAVAVAAGNPRSFLVFSGGPTRIEAGPISEAESYRDIAKYTEFWGALEVEERTRIEPHACDSLGNLVLSLAVFRSEMKEYPCHIIACGFEFKRRRYLQHAKDIGWIQKFHYVMVLSS